MYNKLVNKEAKLALVGLGYVGLPIALEFAKKISVIGFDINESRLAKMREGIDPCGELDGSAFENVDIEFTSSIEKLKEASFFIVAVPTPIDKYNKPDLTPLLGASRSVAKALKPNGLKEGRLRSLWIYGLSGLYGRRLPSHFGRGKRIESRHRF